jgi:hypothetical protein
LQLPKERKQGHEKKHEARQPRNFSCFKAEISVDIWSFEIKAAMKRIPTVFP